MHPLENVIWQALTTRQTEFAESSQKVSRFIPEVSPLAGLREPTPEGYESLAELLSSEGAIGLFLDIPYQDRRGWNLIASAPVLPMVFEDGASLAKLSSASDAQLVEINAEHSPAMTELTALTKPGPFNKRTHELGTFLGICRDGKLVAMAGERLKVPGYT